MRGGSSPTMLETNFDGLYHLPSPAYTCSLQPFNHHRLKVHPVTDRACTEPLGHLTRPIERERQLYVARHDRRLATGDVGPRGLIRCGVSCRTYTVDCSDLHMNNRDHVVFSLGIA